MHAHRATRTHTDTHTHLHAQTYRGKHAYWHVHIIYSEYHTQSLSVHMCINTANRISQLDKHVFSPYTCAHYGHELIFKLSFYVFHLLTSATGDSTCKLVQTETVAWRWVWSVFSLNWAKIRVVSSFWKWETGLLSSEPTTSNCNFFYSVTPCTGRRLIFGTYHWHQVERWHDVVNQMDLRSYTMARRSMRGLRGLMTWRQPAENRTTGHAG
jgi:hypothetical protein